jgi:hypothetical protein
MLATTKIFLLLLFPLHFPLLSVYSFHFHGNEAFSLTPAFCEFLGLSEESVFLSKKTAFKPKGGFFTE